MTTDDRPENIPHYHVDYGPLPFDWSAPFTRNTYLTKFVAIGVVANKLLYIPVEDVIVSMEDGIVYRHEHIWNLRWVEVHECREDHNGGTVVSLEHPVR